MHHFIRNYVILVLFSVLVACENKPITMSGGGYIDIEETISDNNLEPELEDTLDDVEPVTDDSEACEDDSEDDECDSSGKGNKCKDDK